MALSLVVILYKRFQRIDSFSAERADMENPLCTGQFQQFMRLLHLLCARLIDFRHNSNHRNRKRSRLPR